MSKSDALRKLEKQNKELLSIVIRQKERLVLLAEVISNRNISENRRLAAELTAASVLIQFGSENQQMLPTPMYVSQRFIEEWDKFFENEFKNRKL